MFLAFHSLLLSILFLFPKINPQTPASETLVMTKLRDNVYQHTSFLQTQSFGKVDCNGMVVIDGGEAVVFDTPADNASAAELIKWLKDSLNCKVVAVVATHFHEDCVGGLESFHQTGTPSYGSEKTIAFAKAAKFQVPQKSFKDYLELKVGKEKVFVEFNGEGHTRDNVIGYYPAKNIMFGGCLVKEVGASKGNLADANVDAWPATMTKIKKKYPKVEVIIPGHGKTGGVELLDYTFELFSKK